MSGGWTIAGIVAVNFRGRETWTEPEVTFGAGVVVSVSGRCSGHAVGSCSIQQMETQMCQVLAWFHITFLKKI